MNTNSENERHCSLNMIFIHFCGSIDFAVFKKGNFNADVSSGSTSIHLLNCEVKTTKNYFFFSLSDYHIRNVTPSFESYSFQCSCPMYHYCYLIQNHSV